MTLKDFLEWRFENVGHMNKEKVRENPRNVLLDCNRVCTVEDVHPRSPGTECGPSGMSRRWF